MSEVKHTPTPWNEDYIRSIMAAGYTYLMIDGTIPYEVIKQYEPQMNSDAKHATKCVNLHDELVEALKTLVGVIEYYASLKKEDQPNIEDWAYSSSSHEIGIARKVLAKAGVL